MRNGSRILVVDDELATRLRLRDLLERDGHVDVDEAPDGIRALEIANSTPPDLILLDLMMPGMTGIEVCRALRGQPKTREVAIIVLSAAAEAETMLAALDAGADDFLHKPLAAAELRAKVRTITRLNRFRSLTAERDRFRWVLDHSHEPLILSQSDGTVAYANSRAREIFGLGEKDDIVAGISRHFRSDPPDAFAAWRELRWPMDKTFAVFQPETRETPARWFDVEMQAFDGHAGETLLKFTNRSGWVRRELEMFAFQHLIAHKLRTPLNGLAPVFSVLTTLRNGMPEEEVDSLLAMARSSAERLDDTLTGILRYHSAVFGGADDSGRPATVEAVVEIVQRLAELKGLKEQLKLNGAFPEVNHAEMLELVLTELFENCAKFTRAKREGLFVTSTTTDRGCELRICAPGPALAPDVAAQLGRPYWQLERSLTGEISGMGLGLATVRQLLRWRGGELRVTMNQAIGGVEYHVSLPASFCA